MEAYRAYEGVNNAGKVRLIVAGGKTYVQLPATLNQSGKPWVLVSRESSNQTVRTMAALIESVQNAASPGQITAFTSAARRVTLVGNESLDGTRVNHYSIDVDVAKLPDTMPGRQLLMGAGLTSLPVELYVDGEGRPVKLTQDLTVRGQHSSVGITLSKFNEPVSISAPPADQVEVGTSDILIRDVPDDVLAALDAHAARLGVSRSEYIRRRLSQDAARSTSTVSVVDLQRFAAAFDDLADPEVMAQAWE